MDLVLRELKGGFLHVLQGDVFLVSADVFRRLLKGDSCGFDVEGKFFVPECWLGVGARLEAVVESSLGFEVLFRSLVAFALSDLKTFKHGMVFEVQERGWGSFEVASVLCEDAVYALDGDDAREFMMRVSSFRSFDSLNTNMGDVWYWWANSSAGEVGWLSPENLFAHWGCPEDFFDSAFSDVKVLRRIERFFRSPEVIEFGRLEVVAAFLDVYGEEVTLGSLVDTVPEELAVMLVEDVGALQVGSFDGLVVPSVVQQVLRKVFAAGASGSGLRGQDLFAAYGLFLRLLPDWRGSVGELRDSVLAANVG